jgi:FAD/FMN-containing dehydrogenase
VAEAGCILQHVQEAAVNAGRFFAMTLASEGSATIGGLAATNAGGSLTLRYGNMREQVLGMEAVLPDGTLWNGLRSLRKNNSGYDLKQLLIGSEGTLGVITAVCLKLLPKPAERKTAMIALASPEAAIEALSALREKTGDTIAAFELIPAIAIDSAVKYLGQKRPFAKDHPWAALAETHESSEDNRFEAALAQLIEQGTLLDAALAKNLGEAKAFWTLREAIVEAQKKLGASLKHDIAVPVGQMARFIAEGSKLVEKTIPRTRVYAFGHVGDGNIHFNLSQSEGANEAAFVAKRDAMATALHDLALKLGGSISAEHGIGRFKRAELLRTAAPEEIEAMRKIKRALDPDNILNPGVIF